MGEEKTLLDLMVLISSSEGENKPDLTAGSCRLESQIHPSRDALVTLIASRKSVKP